MLSVSKSGIALVAINPKENDTRGEIIVLNDSQTAARLVVPMNAEDAAELAKTKPKSKANQGNSEESKLKTDGNGADESDAEGDGDASDEERKNKVQDGSRAANPLIVRGLDIDEDGKKAIVVTEGALVLLYSLESMELLSYTVMARRPTVVSFTPDSRHALVADRLGDIYAVSIRKLQQGAVPNSAFVYTVDHPSFFSTSLALGHGCVVTAMTFFSDAASGKMYLVTADQESKIRVSNFPVVYDIERFCQGQPGIVSTAVVIAPPPSSSSASVSRLLYTVSGIPPAQSPNDAASPSFDMSTLPQTSPTLLRGIVWNPLTGEQVHSRDFKFPDSFAPEALSKDSSSSSTESTEASEQNGTMTGMCFPQCVKYSDLTGMLVSLPSSVACVPAPNWADPAAVGTSSTLKPKERARDPSNAKLAQQHASQTCLKMGTVSELIFQAFVNVAPSIMTHSSTYSSANDSSPYQMIDVPISAWSGDSVPTLPVHSIAWTGKATQTNEGSEDTLLVLLSDGSIYKIIITSSESPASMSTIRRPTLKANAICVLSNSTSTSSSSITRVSQQALASSSILSDLHARLIEAHFKHEHLLALRRRRNAEQSKKHKA